MTYDGIEYEAGDKIKIGVIEGTLLWGKGWMVYWAGDLVPFHTFRVIGQSTIGA